MEREMILENISTKWNPRESSLWSLSKEGNTLFKQLLVFTTELLIFDCCLHVR